MITLAFFVSGPADLHFETIPKLYPAETCEVEKEKLVKELATSEVVQKGSGKVVAQCVSLHDDRYQELLANMRQSKRISNYAYGNHYRTNAIKLVGQETRLIVPDLMLSSRDTCEDDGREISVMMRGMRLNQDSLVEDVQFKCERILAEEADAILKVLDQGK